MFKSFIHFEFILVYGVSWWSSFIFLHVAVQISQHHVLKRLFLRHFMLCPLCQILIDHRNMNLFMDYFVLLVDVCVLMPDYYNLAA